MLGLHCKSFETDAKQDSGRKKLLICRVRVYSASQDSGGCTRRQSCAEYSSQFPYSALPIRQLLSKSYQHRRSDSESDELTLMDCGHVPMIQSSQTRTDRRDSCLVYAIRTSRTRSFTTKMLSRLRSAVRRLLPMPLILYTPRGAKARGFSHDSLRSTNIRWFTKAPKAVKSLAEDGKTRKGCIPRRDPCFMVRQ